jgi:hypothetical protein
MVSGVKIHSKAAPKAQEAILTEGALQFLAALHRTFESTRQSLLAARDDRQRRWDSGVPIDFPPETAHIREEPSWHCVPPGPGLEDRRVEITGPTDRKMVINALNSGAKTFMADFEGEHLNFVLAKCPYVDFVTQMLAHRHSLTWSMVKSTCTMLSDVKLTLNPAESRTSCLKNPACSLFGM